MSCSNNSYIRESTSQLLCGFHMSDILSGKASCCDITYESIPGSPLPFVFFVGVRGEPGNGHGRICIDGVGYLIAKYISNLYCSCHKYVEITVDKCS